MVYRKNIKPRNPTVLSYVNRLKQSEVYVPVKLPPAEEVQVDFGYRGKFKKLTFD